jgi:hypothetical protein
MEPLLDFRCYHYAIATGCDPHGIELRVKANKTTVEKVLKDIVEFHRIENPTRVITSVTIAGQVIAVKGEKNLVVVSKFEKDRLFATVFQKCRGVKDDLTMRVIFSERVFIPQKEPCCACIIA